MAVIDEAWCIGCTLCLDACPTDAIVGIHKRMHTVIEAHCTGCELCIPACPVDCISLEVARRAAAAGRPGRKRRPTTRGQRYGPHRRRRRPPRPHEPLARRGRSAPADRKRAIVEAALARARAARQPTTEPR